MILERPLFVARTSVESARWSRREKAPFLGRLGLRWLGCATCGFLSTSWLFLVRPTRVGVGDSSSFLSTPFHGFWYRVRQTVSLPRWWMDAALSRVFQILNSSLGSYKQVFKVSFNRILLKDPGGYYSKVSFVKSEVVYTGASHLGGLTGWFSFE